MVLNVLPQPLLDHRPLTWWVVASVAAHGLLMQLLPGWQPAKEKPPEPLQVELRRPPPEITPPKLLPLEPPPPLRERVKPTPLKPQPAPPREERPIEAPRAPILTAPPEAPVTPATPVVPVVPVAPEPKPAPPPPPEPPRAQPAPPPPVTPPRSDAAYLNNPRPAYPLAARRRGDQGTVYVRVLVTADGLAGNVALEKSSGHPSLDEAALSAVKSWRFVPARQGGQAVESPYVVPVVFKLDQ